MREFKGRTAVVTGAASGIGCAMAARFLDVGMNLVLADVDAERLSKVEQSFKESGGNVLGVPTDVSDAQQVQTLAQSTLDRFGAVHVLCNNAGVGYGGSSSWEAPLEAWQWVINVNLMGVVNGIHAFLPMMLEQDSDAHVVNTASIAGLVMNTINVIYGVSKHAVVALSESLHLELLARDARVKVSVLCPGPINTDIMNSSERLAPDSVPPPPEPTPEQELLKGAYQTYLERGMEPGEVAQRVLDAIRNERFYIITHDFNAVIEPRFTNILNSKTPEPGEIPQDFLDILEELMEPANKE
jgi:NAD(P)-dependent dehydrogenase (short-subunit alcohol dehydrogenase family)